MHLPKVSDKTNPEEVCHFINAEFSVRMNPFSVEAWTCLGKIMLHTRQGTKIIILNFTGGLVVCFQRFMCLELLSVSLFAAQGKQAQGHQLRQEAC